MSEYPGGPCETWIDSLACPNLPEAIDDDTATRAIAAATEVLWVLSGRQFGYCDVTVEPLFGCCSRYWPGRALAAYWPEPWVAKPDDCCDHTVMRLAHRPVVSVSEVIVGGEVLDPGSYTLERNELRRTDGSEWPIDDDTLRVSYRYGRPVPDDALIAVQAFACELALALIGDDSCALPERVTTVTRQGVTVAMIDKQSYLDKGRTGLYLVDLFLTTRNPKGQRQRSRVFLPGRRRKERVVT